MGEVYKANDTRLNRTVAPRFSRNTCATIPSEAALQREAQAVAALEHPHICVFTTSAPTTG